MARVRADLEKATLKDLVHDVLLTRLGYGEELTVMSDAGIIYDPDLEDNLEKKLTDLNVGDASFLLVKDDEDEEPRVDLQLAIEGLRSATDDSKAVVLVEEDGEPFDVPRKPKRADVAADGGDAAEDGADGLLVSNGTSSTAAPNGAKRKRPLDDVDAEESGTPAKKLQGPVAAEVAKDPAMHAIVIDETTAHL